ncbi:MULTISPECIES: hypothetical protein [Bacillus]|uniref:hypothetical protein n=1 Tax=Bacillus TaxID=1386 RepID=UPI00077B1BAC|nr:MULTISPECIES: hypothetical protein [Bacillus cereus group]OTY59831.1 hypothetical protein BK748_11820 [Bacillus thuringiensis serovar graciosensis]PFD88659.1 hypothetical protein CN275_17685 [Bacillus anthracis]KXY86692.1 hypothetical protein AT270_14780 [Bacillus cereus]MBG9936892.1 hypothetical protein [Bacillus tropicus]MED2991698.1 hypothetical protein [Bacillus tropicus]
MSIRIGDKNKIKNSSIGHQYNNLSGEKKNSEEKKTFSAKYPLLASAVVSLLIGFLLLFNFWKDIVNWIENLF